MPAMQGAGTAFSRHSYEGGDVVPLTNPPPVSVYGLFDPGQRHAAGYGIPLTDSPVHLVGVLFTNGAKNKTAAFLAEAAALFGDPRLVVVTPDGRPGLLAQLFVAHDAERVRPIHHPKSSRIGVFLLPYRTVRPALQLTWIPGQAGARAWFAAADAVATP